MTVDLDAQVVVRRGAFALDVDVHVEPGEALAVLGPNGAGKTTLLHALAGLLSAQGRVVLGGTPAPEARRRRVGLVFQEPSLFPHLSVLDNVAFGPRARGASKARSRAAAREWLARLELDELAGRAPLTLSGGQAQRVAIARALAAEPLLLLLDEPLAAVDQRARADVRDYLARHLHDFKGPIVLVTHDLLDALVLAGRTMVLEGGRVVEQGTTQDVASRPRSGFVASLADLNLVHGTADGTTVRTRDGRVVVGNRAVSGAATAVFPPAAVAVYTARPDGSPRNVWRARVARVEQRGATVRVVSDDDPPMSADVTLAAAAALGLRPGAEVWLSVKATQVEVYAS